MIFLVVGTQFPFDRLVKAVDSAFEGGWIEEELFAQIGQSSYKPRNFQSAQLLEKKSFDKRLKEASAIISHAGMGIMTIALDNEKPLLVMPRLKKYGEVVNDHQTAIARKFEEFGHILVAYKAEDLARKITDLKTFVPRKRNAQPQAVADRISRFLRELAVIKNGAAK